MALGQGSLNYFLKNSAGNERLLKNLVQWLHGSVNLRADLAQ